MKFFLFSYFCYTPLAVVDKFVLICQDEKINLFEQMS